MKLFLKIAVAVVIIALLVWQVDYDALLQTLSRLTLPAFVFLMYISGVMIYVSAVKWKVFLDALRDPGSRPAPLSKLISLYLVGYFVNLIMPSYLGGDIVRSWYAGKSSGQHEALSATVLERYTGIVAMILLGLTLMWFTPLATSELRAGVLVLAAGLTVGTVLALSPAVLDLTERVVFKPFRLTFAMKHLRKIQGALLLASKKPAVLAESLALSLLYHSLTVVNTAATGYAVGWMDPPLTALFVVLPLILLLGAVPLTPSGIGIQEGAFYVFLVQVGATPEQALGIGVILRAKTYVLAAAGGVVWFFGYRGDFSQRRANRVGDVERAREGEGPDEGDSVPSTLERTSTI